MSQQVALASTTTDISEKTIRNACFIHTANYQDTGITFKWRLNNFALLTMRHHELRSPEFEGPLHTRWICVLVLGDPRLKKAEERTLECQLYLAHCPDESAGLRVSAGQQILPTDEQFAAVSSVPVELTNGVTRCADPNTVQHTWMFPSNLTTLFTEKCVDTGALRMVVSLAVDDPGTVIHVERKLRTPVEFPNVLPGLEFLNDLFFLTADGKRVPAHKAYMREVSSVLRETIDAMGTARDYGLKQFSTTAVMVFVVYCYTGFLHETVLRGHGTQVLKLGHVLGVPAVITESADYCLRNLESEGAVRCFQMACEYGMHGALKRAAVQDIARSYCDVGGPWTEALSPGELAELHQLLSELRSCNVPL